LPPLNETGRKSAVLPRFGWFRFDPPTGFGPGAEPGSEKSPPFEDEGLTFLPFTSTEATLTALLSSTVPVTLALTFFPGCTSMVFSASLAWVFPWLSSCTTLPSDRARPNDWVDVLAAHCFAAASILSAAAAACADWVWFMSGFCPDSWPG
jgi:hypothetical protein